MPGEPWAPGLADVARHCPTRTRDTKTPGSDKLLNTFNGNTTPDDSTVQQMIDDTLASLEALVGDVPGVTATHPELATALRVYVEFQVASDIELAYPNRDADIQTASALNARAQAQLKAIQQALAGADMGQTAVDPVWAFPDPALTAYADESPGSGADLLLGRFRWWEVFPLCLVITRSSGMTRR